MRVHHMALRSREIDRCAAFYRDVLGLRERALARDPSGLVRSRWLDAGDAVLMIERADEREPDVPAGSMEFLAFAVTPAEREVFRARLADAGCAVEAETTHTLYFRDPDGRRVGVSSYPFAT